MSSITPPVPAAGRVPRSSASSSVSTALFERAFHATQSQQRMLQQRQQVLALQLS